MDKIKIVQNRMTVLYVLIAIFICFFIDITIFCLIRNDNNAKTVSAVLNGDEEQSVEKLTSNEDINDVDSEKEVKQTNKKKVVTTPKYYIKVNYKAQVVTIYKKDKKGKYTVPVKAMVCSTGTNTPTSGVYKIPYKYNWLRMIGGVYTQYATQVVGDILFHSVPYLEKGNHASLEYWAYDKLGTKASLGCIRLTCIDAKWIYDNCEIGTQVEFYSSSNPGPLGKPTARKISNAPKSVRGWDPTDPAKENPWGKYLKELAEKEKEKEEKKSEIVPNENTISTENDINNDIQYNNDTLNEEI